MKNPFLIGSHVYLRPVEREDAPCFVQWLNDSEVIRTLLRYQPLTQRAEEAFLEKVMTSEQDVILALVVKETDQLIGATGLHQLNHRCRHANFGIFIGEKSQWGKGYGSEATGLMVRYAFETLNLNRVWLHVYQNNSRGLRAYEKVGFRREGILRQDTYREGRYWDTIVMAILREEWETG